MSGLGEDVIAALGLDVGGSDDNVAASSEKSKRMKGVVMIMPFVHGSISTWMGESADNERSHRWTVYLRSLDNADLSHLIRRVVFTLHESFDNHCRSKSATRGYFQVSFESDIDRSLVVDAPPFEVTEYGWGEVGALSSFVSHLTLMAMSLVFDWHQSSFPGSG